MNKCEIRPILLLFGVGSFLYSCQTQEPVRKKMPEMINNEGTEWGKGDSYSEDQYRIPTLSDTYYAEVNIVLDGENYQCIRVSPSDMEQDSALFSLVDSYSVLANVLLPQWQQQSNKGVLIDLRMEKGTEAKRSDFKIQQKGIRPIPVFVMWDNNSETRAQSYIYKMQNIKNINVTKVNN